jgi:hypothetical protein
MGPRNYGEDVATLEAEEIAEEYEDGDYVYEWDDDGDLDDMEAEEEIYGAGEARKRRRFPRMIARRRIPTARGGGYLRRTLGGYARNDKVQEALTRVGTDVSKNRTGINVIRKSLNSVSRGVSVNSRNIAAARKDIDNTKQMFLLMSLLAGDKKYEILKPESGNVTGGGDITLKDKSDTMDKMLPVLLMGGLGGGTDGLMKNPLMLIVLMEALKPPEK